MLANGDSTLQLWATAWGSGHVSGTTQAVTATLNGQQGEIVIALPQESGGSPPDNLSLWEDEWSVTADVPHGANEVVYRGQDDTGYVGEASPHGLYVDRDPPNAPSILTPRLTETYTDQNSIVVKGQAELYVTVLLFVNGEPHSTTQANAN
ncbi:MAG: hypothetical protein PVF45_15175, partial [Anaerolineae bacterium]